MPGIIFSLKKYHDHFLGNVYFIYLQAEDHEAEKALMRYTDMLSISLSDASAMQFCALSKTQVSNLSKRVVWYIEDGFVLVLRVCCGTLNMLV